MATTKLYDLAVKVGEYQDRDGNMKGRYENVGAVMRNDNGQFMMLKKTFNPAGVASDRDSILISMFEPRTNGNDRYEGKQQSQGQQSSGYGAGGRPSGGGFDDMDSEIPF